MPSPIPTAAEAAANPALIEPARAGRTRRGLGALVGAGLLGSLLAPIAGCSEREVAAPTAEPTTAPAVPDPADAEVAARAEAAREAVVTVVAPILQKALDEEGRGWFGCIAIDPPYVLNETEALEFIQQEFEKAGVTLRRECEISGFMRTVPDKDSEAPGAEERLYPSKKTPGNWVFDLATEDGSLAVEFLSRQDAFQESFYRNRDIWFDECGFELSELAQRLRGDFVTRTNGAPVTIGLFFDPLPTTTVWDAEQKKHVPRPNSSFSSLSEAGLESLNYRATAYRKELLQHDALELLREQVQYFLDWARKEGKIPLNGDPT